MVCYMLPGVGFARMESREKCEQIIQIFNGQQLPNAKDGLLVKFADGGSKKKNAFNKTDQTQRPWRDGAEGVPVTYDPTAAAAASMPQNGIGVNVGTPIVGPYGRFNTPPVSGYAISSQWVPGYMMPPQQITQVDEQVSEKFIDAINSE